MILGERSQVALSAALAPIAELSQAIRASTEGFQAISKAVGVAAEGSRRLLPALQVAQAIGLQVAQAMLDLDAAEREARRLAGLRMPGQAERTWACWKRLVLLARRFGADLRRILEEDDPWAFVVAAIRRLARRAAEAVRQLAAALSAAPAPLEPELTSGGPRATGPPPEPLVHALLVAPAAPPAPLGASTFEAVEVPGARAA